MQWAVGGKARIYCGNNGTIGHCFAEVNLGPLNTNETGRYLKERYQLTTGAKMYGHTDASGDFWIALDKGVYPGGYCEGYEKGVIYYPQEGYCQQF